MANQDLNQTEKNALEALIDLRGIDSVLMAISDICGEKGEHVAANWQDRTLALRWHTLCGAVGTIVPKATGLVAGRLPSRKATSDHGEMSTALGRLSRSMRK